MNSFVKLIGICLFIGGCCTFSPANKKCTCREVYKEVKYYLNENVDTTQNFATRFIENKQPHLENEIFDKIEFYFYDNEDCWIGQKKQLIIDLLGKPSSNILGDKAKYGNFISYTFTIEEKSQDLIKRTTSSIYITIYYKKDLNSESINKLLGSNTRIILE
jgi:hypothetical protein